MKFFSIQKRQSQTHPSNLALRLLALIILLLPLGLNTARATDYIFYVNVSSHSIEGYLGVDANGNLALVPSGSFSEGCVWHCSSNTNDNPTAANLDKDHNRYLYTTVGNTKYWLIGGTTNGNSPTVVTSNASAGWRNDGNRLRWRVDGNNNNYFLYYREGSWRVSSQASQNNANAYSSGNGTEYRSTTISGFFYGYYKIKNVQSGNSNYYLAVSNNNYQTGKPYLCTKQNPGNEGVWWLQPYGGSYHNITHVQDCKRVVTNNNNNNSERVVHLETTDAGSAYNIVKNGNNNNYFIYPQSNTDRSFNQWGGNGGDIGWYGTGSDGSKWIFESATYSLPAPTIAFDNNSNTVTISCTNSNASIYYTSDDSAPSDASTPYSSSFTQSTPATIKAMAYLCSGIATSTIAQLQISKVATPTISDVANGQITITTTTPGATIYYKTTDGGTYQQYTSPISATGIGQLWAYAKKNNCINSDVAFRAYADPEGITLTSDNPMTIYKGQTGNISYTLTPNPCYNNVTFSSANTSIATVATNGTVTGVAVGQTTITLQPKLINGDNASFNTTVTVTVKDKVATPIITFAPTASDDGATATTTITCATDDVTIYYKINDGTQQTYSTSFVVNDNDVVKAWAVKNNDTDDNYDDSEENTQTYVSCKLPTPTISVTSGGVSFSCSNPDATIRYTTDGSNPTESSTAWNGTTITTLADGATIKAIATSSDCGTSDIATATNHKSGVSGGVVTLNDLEDHNWTYYAGVSSDVDGGNYNITYLSTSSNPKMYNPDPRNVKITYKGVDLSGNLSNAVAISGSESENVMVYYETIEKVQPGESGDYAYTLIPNPFSKRPKNGNTYYGFAGWKLVSGASHIQRASGKAAPVDGSTVFDLDEPIHFKNLNANYTPNCISADIVLEATWSVADVRVQNTLPNFTSGTYETNFWVVNSNPSGAITLTQNMTMTQLTPDGGATGNYTGTAFTKGITCNAADGVTPKIEWMNLNEGTQFDPNGKNMFIGRGVTNSQSPSLFFFYSNSNTTVNQVVRVESGKFGSIRHYNKKPSAVTKQVVILGCDYDRAKGDNTKLTVSGTCVYSDNDVVTDNTIWGTRTFIKSGVYCSALSDPSSNVRQGEDSYYYMGKTSSSSKLNQGRRYLEIQGGDLMNLAGGSGSHGNNPDQVALALRMKGGTFHGIVFGCSRGNNSNGSRTMVFTGGKAMRWVTPGTNGTVESAGALEGYAYLYIGGNFEVNSNGDTRVWCHSLPGNVFGSGSGMDRNEGRVSGSNTMGTNTVVADNAYVERGVYGGGSFGYCSATANIYITGGHVAGVAGGVENASSVNSGYTADIPGGVYGGSCQNKGGSANIYMTGGLVESGIYGGSNAYGTMSGNTNVRIVGGQVGTSTTSANVHGGGYGASTVVSGNVDVTLGTKTGEGDVTYTTSGDAVIYGDVYGGSALGNVNGTSSSSYHTNVTLNAGTIHGSLYGGGLGDNNIAANVYGHVAVKVYGGSVKKTDENGANGSGAVYGCNNINGAPQGNVFVYIYGTDPAPAEGEYALFSVYGGGNKADYDDSPDVTVHNCDNSIEYVYGGGNAAAVLGTSVTIYGGNKIGNVFGGGNGTVSPANIGDGGTSVTIYGGTIGNVFGGSNSGGTIEGEIGVVIYPLAEDGTPCPINIDNLYGGGNKAASNAGTLTISCGDDFHIGNVYGGANQADITGGIELNITSGYIDNVFGGNNTSGSINGTITVNIEADPSCGMEVGNVYGGGNKAAYTAPDGNADYPQVNIIKGKVLHDVFGGGLGSSALVTGNPQVNMTGGLVGGTLYGGGSAAPVKGNPHVKMNVSTTHSGSGEAKSENWWDVKGYVFGGGLGESAEVDGSTQVEILGTSRIGKNVYGGGNGGAVTGNTDVTIGEDPE